MARYLAGRSTQAALTIFLVVALTFVLARIAGDPTAPLLPATATEADAAEFRRALGLDQPIIVQFLSYLGDMFRLDFGESLRGGGSAFDVVMDRIPATLSLAGISLFVSPVLALGLGLVVELTRSERLRSAILTLALLREAVPVFVFGLLLVARDQMPPDTGTGDPGADRRSMSEPGCNSRSPGALARRGESRDTLPAAGR